MAIRTFDQIVIDLLTNVLRQNGQVDISPGQVFVDTVINPPAQEFATAYATIDSVKTAQSLANANIMSATDLDNLVSNYGITRNPATSSTGQVVFYSSTQPTSDFSIPAGTTVATGVNSNSVQIKFKTLNTANFIAAIESSYFNVNTGNWELTVDVQSVQAGNSSNVGPFTINSILNFATPFKVINRNAMTGALDQESNNDLAFRALQTFTGNNKGTKNGYLGTILSQPNVSDALVVGPGDPLMDRDGGQGGKVDIWVLTPAVSSVQLNPTNTSSLLINWNNQTQSLLGYKFTFPQLPLDVESPVNLVGTTSPNNPLTNVQLFESRNPAPSGLNYIGAGQFHYTLVKSDDLDFANSFEANDFIIWNPITLETLRTYPSGINTGNSLQIGITYSFNNTVNVLQTLINSDANKIITADVLIKAAIKINVDVTMNVVLLSQYTTTPNIQQQTVNTIITTIDNYINSTKLGTKVQESDLIEIVHQVPGVSNIIVNSINITERRNSIYNLPNLPVVDAIATSNEFFSSGLITINVLPG